MKKKQYCKTMTLRTLMHYLMWILTSVIYNLNYRKMNICYVIRTQDWWEKQHHYNYLQYNAKPLAPFLWFLLLFSFFISISHFSFVCLCVSAWFVPFDHCKKSRNCPSTLHNWKPEFMKQYGHLDGWVAGFWRNPKKKKSVVNSWEKDWKFQDFLLWWFFFIHYFL